MKRITTLLLAFVAVAHAAIADVHENLKKITLPPGFEISIYAEGVRNARQIAIGDKGTVFAGSRTANNVYAIIDSDGDYKADEVKIILAKDQVLPDGTVPNMPSGIAFKDGSLYVSALTHILRFDNIEDNLDNPGDPVIVTSSLPGKRHHGWKFIAFGPDEKLYVPVGAPCNTCPQEDEFMTILRMNADGSDREVVAQGVRNTVGFDWHPETGDLWFTDNGVDGLGDDMPADELNRLSEVGQHFGFPYVHQGDTLDQRYGRGKNVSDYVAPAQKLNPHTAALGMRFYEGSMFPDEYKNVIFIAEHGSWNRSEKIGYQITTVVQDGEKGTRYLPFATGWLEGERAWGRPCDVEIMKDGSMLVSDTNAHVLYRITYK